MKFKKKEIWGLNNYTTTKKKKKFTAQSLYFLTPFSVFLM